MDYEKWISEYKPNMTRQSQVVLFETFGEDLKKIQKTDPSYVWTVVDTDNDDLAILPGIHYVNRISYVVTKIPHGQDNVEEVIA